MASRDPRRTAAITPAMVARTRIVAEPRWSPAGGSLAWAESGPPALGGDGPLAVDLVVTAADGSTPPAVVTADTGVGGVSAHGGACFDWVSEDLLVVVGADGRLYEVAAAGGPPRALVTEGRAAAPAVSPDGARVAFVWERDDDAAVAVVDRRGGVPVVCSRADYAWDPAWSADGGTLAWCEWDLPDMPWDASRVVLAPVGEGGAAGTPTVVAGGDETAAGQPRFAPNGEYLAYMSDATGLPQVWVARADGSRARPHALEAHEHAEPAWAPGQRSYAWNPFGTAIAWCRNEMGFGRLVKKGVRGASAPPFELARAWHRSLHWGPRGIVAVRSGARTPSQLVVTDAKTGSRRVLARGPMAGFEAADPVEPEHVAWGEPPGTVPGLLFRPPGVATPPLVVDVHGGPTGQALADWDARTQWLVSRGYAVLRPNPRGSTGYGRAYAQALAGAWGVVDVDDVIAGIEHAVAAGWADPRRVAISGGSAGGFTALLVAIRRPDLVRAVWVRYPVTDLAEAARTTHRFESGYFERIVGPWPPQADVYAERSPIADVHELRTPLLVLQGADDLVVRREQVDHFVASLRTLGADVEYVVYTGEGHGFRRTTSVIDELERAAAFLEHWIGR